MKEDLYLDLSTRAAYRWSKTFFPCPLTDSINKNEKENGYQARLDSIKIACWITANGSSYSMIPTPPASLVSYPLLLY